MDNSESDPNDSDDASSVSSFRSDASSEITELDPTDFAGYFRERDGRLFHSHGNSPYPLPVDAPEQERVNGQHEFLHRLLGSNYLGPVQDVVRRKKRVLDLCTGTGRWALDMAREFPNVRFDGTDIVPIATRTPPDNVFIEMADINEQWRYQAGMFDFVHARSISLAVHDYPGMLDQVARVLRPNGLFLACEWGRFVVMRDGRNLLVAAPSTYQFFEAVKAALLARGVVPVAENLERWIRESGRFDRIEARCFEVPIGDWDQTRAPLGTEYRDFLSTYAESLKALLVESGRRAMDVDVLIREMQREMREVRGMVCYYFTVHARRIRV